jgi:gamma-glutamyltranspeptidase / glutathione hydrolase
MGIVVAPQAMAADIGAQVLARGGNAVDAAVTVAFVQGVLDPLNCGIGGFGCMVLYFAETRTWQALSFHARAGALAREGMWKDLVEEEYARGADGFRLKDYVNDIGYQSIATPGTVSGLSAALGRAGSQDWRSTIEPAVPFALDGYRITPKARVLFRRSPRLAGPHPAMRGTATTAARSIFTRDGHAPWEEGDLFVQEDYGNTLLRLADLGDEDFYKGELGRRIAADVGRWGGFVTLEDLRDYAPKWQEPLVGSYRGYRVVTVPPPACGLTLLEMLRIAERFELCRYDHSSPEHLDLVARIMRWAYRDRALYVADPDFSPVPVDALLSEDRATEAQDVIEHGDEIVVPRWKPIETGTTHVCVSDKNGNLVSLTHTLGASSGVVSTGLGFVYNNAMNCFDPIPGRPNSIAPAKARVTGMTPAVLDNGRGSQIVIGAPGGAMITNGVFQVISNIVDFGMSATEAVSAPRIDCQGEVIELEARLPEKVLAGLTSRGNAVLKSVASYWAHPLVQVIVLAAGNKGADGGSDPRGEGAAVTE